MAENEQPASNPTGNPVDQATLTNQLEALQARLKEYKDKGLCFPSIDSQIAEIQALAKDGKLADAQALYAKTIVAVDRALTSDKNFSLARRLLVVEVGYLLVIIALGYLVERYPDYSLWKDLVGYNAKAAWFGALGGITIGIYGIYTHISAKDFDPSYRLWYICKPVMGAIFGWFVFLVYYVGVITAVPNQGDKALDFQKPQLAYLIAFLAGFSERFTIKTIDRFMTVLTGGDDKKKNTGNQKDIETPEKF